MERNFAQWSIDILREYVFWHRDDDEAWGIYLERIRPSMRPGPDLTTEVGQQEFVNILQEQERQARKRQAAGFEHMTLRQLRSYGLSHMDNLRVWQLYLERLGIPNTASLPPDPTTADIAGIVRAGFCTQG